MPPLSDLSNDLHERYTDPMFLRDIVALFALLYRKGMYLSECHALVFLHGLGCKIKLELANTRDDVYIAFPLSVFEETRRV